MFERLYYHTIHCGAFHPLHTTQLFNYGSRVFIINFLPTKAYSTDVAGTFELQVQL
jgi:hypothetical protein